MSLAPSSRLTRLRVIRGWRRYAEIIARAVEATIPDASVYLAGGAAEGRLTILSDVDVVVVLPRDHGFGGRSRLGRGFSRPLNGLASHSTRL